MVGLNFFFNLKRHGAIRKNPASTFYNGALLVLVSLICDSSQDREGVTGTNGISSVATTESDHVLDINMPGVRPTRDDHYLCTAFNVEAYGTQYIHAFEPNSNADRAHHMLLFTCDDVPDYLKKDGFWDCGHHYQACKKMRIMYAWAKNAPPTTLPKDVGFRIGVESNIKNIVLQVHYAHPLPEGSQDHSGFRLHFTSEEPKYLAGIMLMYRSMLTLPPFTDKIHGDMNCVLEANAPIHPFAYRVHTHKLGVVVSGYRLDPASGQFESIGKGNPQWPQAFYPTKTKVTINPSDYVVAQCTFSTKDFDKTTQIGMTAGDEMCNLYLMYYTVSRDPEDHNLDCGDEQNPQISQHLPMDSDVPLPRNKTLEEHATGHHSTAPINLQGGSSSQATEKSHSKKRPGIEFNTTPEGFPQSSPFDYSNNRIDSGRALKTSNYKAVPTWPDSSVVFGQASGVDFDTAGNVVVFHRGDRVWDYHTFDNRNNFRQKEKGPIKDDTVLILDPVTGVLLHKWGKDMFYMPHDITVDRKGNFWLTDVALHQVFKFSPGKFEPSLVLGTRFEPGSDNSHFCKPAAVSVMSSGDFFVADGYCNSRVIKFNSRGDKILEWGRAFQPNGIGGWLNKLAPPPYAFQIPHALALAEEHDLLCVADRENGRIQCFKASSGTFEFKIESLDFGGRLFSVAYSPVNGGTLVAVNGPNGRFSKRTVQGFIIPVATQEISSVFKPDVGFGNPHDVCFSRNGNDIYVVEISQPYKVWKFSANGTSSTRAPFGKQLSPTNHLEPHESHVQHHAGPAAISSNNEAVSIESGESTSPNEDSLGASVFIMAFLTIPLLLLIGIGAMIRLRNSCCRRKETKSFSEFFPPSAGFEKLRMDETDSDNSDTEIEEFNASMYRKTSA